MERHGIKHIRSAPYHPATNELAKRFVQTFKRAMKASEGEGKTLNQRLSQYLFSYRASPQATTNTSPSELFLGRPMRTKFDLLKPNSRSRVISKQAKQKAHHDHHAKLRCFTQGQAVMVRDFRPNSSKWMQGVVLQQIGPVSYTIEVNGKLLKRHVDHLRQRGEPVRFSDLHTADHTIPDNFQYPEMGTASSDQVSTVEPSPEQPVLQRYPRRDRQPPDRFTFD